MADIKPIKYRSDGKYPKDSSYPFRLEATVRRSGEFMEVAAVAFPHQIVVLGKTRKALVDTVDDHKMRDDRNVTRLVIVLSDGSEENL